jgi:hypothetical protein
VSAPAARKTICKPDVPGWDGTEETEQTERAVLVPVRRGHRVRERSSETPETCVVLLITQRPQYRLTVLLLGRAVASQHVWVAQPRG